MLNISLTIQHAILKFKRSSGGSFNPYLIKNVKSNLISSLLTLSRPQNHTMYFSFHKQRNTKTSKVITKDQKISLSIANQLAFQSTSYSVPHPQISQFEDTNC